MEVDYLYPESILCDACGLRTILAMAKCANMYNKSK